MNDPNDDDLRSAFRRWRILEAEWTPPFPGMPKANRRQVAGPGARLAIAASLAAAATAAAVLIVLQNAAPPPGSSLAAILPRPLLSSSASGADFLPSRPMRAGHPSGSDFLLPPPLLPSASRFLNPNHHP